jgi:hypothetical protein
LEEETTMAKSKQLMCTECSRDSEVAPERTFLGFVTFTCPNCKKKAVHPYPIVLEILQSILGVVFFAGFVSALIHGVFSLWGLLFSMLLLTAIPDIPVRLKCLAARRKQAELARTPTAG